MLAAPAASAFAITDSSTLTGQANGTGTLVVGGYVIGREQDLQGRTQVAPNSGRGPAREGLRDDVDALAPSDLFYGDALRGIWVLANRTPDPNRGIPRLSTEGQVALAGTSLAAPWVARQVCNAVTADPTLKTKPQIVARLRAESAAGRGPPGKPIAWVAGATATA